MPIYEYRCECGATLEALEPMGARRELCGELCVRRGKGAQTPGSGHLERILSATGIRGDGREAKAPVFDPVRQQNSPAGCDSCDVSDGEAFS
jgi:hypothetical protein